MHQDLLASNSCGYLLKATDSLSRKHTSFQTGPVIPAHYFRRVISRLKPTQGPLDEKFLPPWDVIWVFWGSPFYTDLGCLLIFSSEIIIDL